MPDLRVTEIATQAVSVTAGELELCRYIVDSDAEAIESPRPYLHPVRTLAGDIITLYRPHDHPWHHGISLALPNVGEANFWGGGMLLRGSDGTVREALNNGVQRHDGFDESGVVDGGGVAVAERLSWVTEHGETWIAERRRLAVRVLPDEQAWVLSFATTLTNTRASAIEFGSPTTNGRPNAGYGGLFWRGRRELDGGTVVLADGPESPGGPFGSDASEVMGKRGRWLSYTGRHDGHGRSSTVVFVDRPANPRHPTKWFVRSRPYACVCPAPFFDQTYRLPAEESVSLSYHIVIANGAWDRARVEAAVSAWTS
jgi:Methane oxygenase PmoA